MSEFIQELWFVFLDNPIIGVSFFAAFLLFVIFVVCRKKKKHTHYNSFSYRKINILDRGEKPYTDVHPGVPKLYQNYLEKHKLEPLQEAPPEGAHYNSNR
jgi:hypothetical protein